MSGGPVRPAGRRRKPVRLEQSKAPAVVIAVAVIALVVGLIVLIDAKSGSRGGGALPPIPTSAPPTTLSPAQEADQAGAKAFDATAQTAFGGEAISTNLTDLVDGTDMVVTGKRSVADQIPVTDRVVADFTAARARVVALPPYTGDATTKPLYLVAAQGYVDAATVYRAVLDLPAGDLRGQVLLAGRRLRELADRTFDRGRASITASLRDVPNPDVQISLAEEVPDWEAEGLAAGPPIAAVPPPAAPYPPQRQPTRPSGTRAAWLAALDQAGAPPAAAVAAAVTGTDPARLAAVADGTGGAAEALRSVPDPEGDRELSARTRTALLWHMEAARQAQLALAAGPGPVADALRPMAVRTALLGDRLWDPSLPPRATGLDPAALPF